MLKKLFSIILVFTLVLGLVGCGTTPKSNTKEENKVYSLGEEAIIKDKKGNDIYSLKIDNVTKDNNFEYKNDFSHAKEIIKVTYTYKNIAKKDNTLYIHGQDLQVIDSEGKVAKGSSMFPERAPQEIQSDTSCTVDAFYGLENESNEVTIVFESKQYGTIFKFKVPVK